MSLFDREEREEAARVKQFGDLLEQVRKPEFWKELSRKQAASGGDDSLVRSIERRAEGRGVPPAALFGEYLTRVRSSTYPTPDCLDPEAVQALSASQAPTPQQAQHLETCRFCRELVDACQSGEAEREYILAAVRDALPQDAPPEAPAGDPVPPSEEWTQWLDGMRTAVQAGGVDFARRYPASAPIVVVDDTNVIDPDRWDRESLLRTLRETYDDVETALEGTHRAPLCRVMVLKDDVSAYDDRYLAAIRNEIVRSRTWQMYFVPRHRAREFGEHVCTVVGNDTVFEIAPAGPQSADASLPILAAAMVQDGTRARKLRFVVEGLDEHAFQVYPGGVLNPRLTWALESLSNDRLRRVLREVAESK